MTHVTCRLTAKNLDQLRNPTLGSRVWATFTFLKTLFRFVKSVTLISTKMQHGATTICRTRSSISLADLCVCLCRRCSAISVSVCVCVDVVGHGHCRLFCLALTRHASAYRLGIVNCQLTLTLNCLLPSLTWSVSLCHCYNSTHSLSLSHCELLCNVLPTH